MTFHPLLFSVSLGEWFQNQTYNLKICFCPIFAIIISIVLLIEIIVLPIRMCFHELIHIYSDQDESEWSYPVNV